MKHDLRDQRFGRLIVVAEAPPTPSGDQLVTNWFCVCDCGGSKAVRAASLVGGRTQSCGCIHKEQLIRRKYKHGHSLQGHTTRTYRSWYGMLSRCTNPNHKDWQYYGGRSIVVCARWKDFRNFLADMGERPEGKTLDRYPNNDGNYEPSNCRWATPAEQEQNKRFRQSGH